MESLVLHCCHRFLAQMELVNQKLHLGNRLAIDKVLQSLRSHRIRVLASSVRQSLAWNLRLWNLSDAGRHMHLMHVLLL